MHLLNTSSFVLKDFPDETVPPVYSIFSHRWSNNPQDEVSFQDLQDPAQTAARQRHGWHKVVGACRVAKSRGYKYIWIDTCCINDADPEERRRVVNQMFFLYLEADVCIAYLEDVPGRQSVVLYGQKATMADAFRDSDWFARGWTLQELLAPEQVVFYNQDFECIGNKHDHCQEISQITGIEEDYVDGSKPILDANLATRLSWVSRRFTKWPEDITYCMLGLLGVKMSLNYNEGAVRAFKRLQMAIIEQWDRMGYTLYAWLPDPRESSSNDNEPFDLLARSPRDFRRSQIFLRTRTAATHSVRPIYGYSNRVTHISHLFPSSGRGKNGRGPDEAFLTLPCRHRRTGEYLVLELRRIGDYWYRVGCSGFQWSTEPPTQRGYLRDLQVRDPWRYDDASRKWHKEIDVTQSALARREHRERRTKRRHKKEKIAGCVATALLVGLVMTS